MVLVGALMPLGPVVGGNLIGGRRSLAGSAIDGMPETQEMIDSVPNAASSATSK
jgi:uncharacterized zinc-type alcohol dehydrogenase-like protein